GDRTLAPRHHGHAGLPHQEARANLVSHLLDDTPGRAHEDQAGLLAGLGEAPVLREEAVAWMDRLGARAPSGLEDALDIEVALAGRSGSDENGLVGLPSMRPVRVGFGIDSDGPDTESPRRAENPARDLPTIGDEDALDHAQAGWLCSTLTRSKAPTRHPPPLCSQRALTVTVRLSPASRYFTMRGRPSLQN